MKTPKNHLIWTLAALLCMIFSYCQKDPKTDSEGMVIFKIGNQKNLKSTNPEAAAVIVSIMQGSHVIFDRNKLELTYLNGTYLSKGIFIPDGSYKITEFLVTDTANHVIYATPLAGSPLAQLVNNPLPISFDVTANTEQVISPEVISTDTIQPADLGYAGFSFNPVSTIKFYVTAYTSNDDPGNPEPLDSSELSISSTSGKNYSFLLRKNKPNYIQVKAETGKFILKASKYGYVSWIDTLSETELNNYFISPLHVVLHESKSIWFKMKPYDKEYFGPEIDTYYDTEFTVDWGNGTTEVLHTTNSHLQIYKARYTGNFIKLTGDMRSIRILKAQTLSNASFADYKEMNIQNAVRLEEFYLARDSTMHTINLSNMHFLKQVNFFNATTLPDVTNCENLETLMYVGALRNYDYIDIRTNQKLKTLALLGQRITYGDNPYLTNISQQFGVVDFPSILKSVQNYPRQGTIYYSYMYKPPWDIIMEAEILKAIYNWSITYQYVNPYFSY